MYFTEREYVYISLQFVSNGPIDNESALIHAIILEPNMRKAIARTNIDNGFWRYMASLDQVDIGLGDQIHGLVQECSISIANALEILQSCTKSSRWHTGSHSYLSAVMYIEHIS